jgi:hypothetical protein
MTKRVTISLLFLAIILVANASIYDLYYEESKRIAQAMTL